MRKLGLRPRNAIFCCSEGHDRPTCARKLAQKVYYNYETLDVFLDIDNNFYNVYYV
jgi:hypothetical protein